MRADKYSPRYIHKLSRRRIYDGFWDWLGWHLVGFINVLLAYVVYIVTTDEV